MLRLVALVLACLALAPGGARAERRVALVLGNAAYEAATQLANPVNDAADLAQKLRSLGFEVVEGENLGKRDMERRIGEFADALDGADVGLLFYAGHGLQVDGRNYIVPVDARLDVPVKLRLEAVPMDEILDIMEQQAKTSLVFLDACRNNPFGRGLSSSRSAKPLPGLAQFDAARGSFIAFSTGPGSVALDGTGRNSPFAAALLRHIAAPGQSISDLMIAVRGDVLKATRDQQRPWEQGSLVERFEFVPEGGAAAVAAEAPAGGGQQVALADPPAAGLERAVGDLTGIEGFVAGRYLAPDAGRMRETVRALYADNALIYGTPYGFDALVKIKQDWFARFAAWQLALEPGTLAVTPQGTDRALAVFTMRYDYRPKDGSAALAGRARVTLGLVAGQGGWRIASETSELVQ
ncbi:MAG: caspase family protein [Rhizobiaceae bacterium]|nr:caspase family protein [Rhizobiaceae bacterium]